MGGDHAQYCPTGNGRDSYIYANNGGLKKVSTQQIGKGFNGSLKSTADQSFNLAISQEAQPYLFHPSESSNKKQYSMRSAWNTTTNQTVYKRPSSSEMHAVYRRQQVNSARLSTPKTMTFQGAPPRPGTNHSSTGRTTTPHHIPNSTTTEAFPARMPRYHDGQYGSSTGVKGIGGAYPTEGYPGGTRSLSSTAAKGLGRASY